MFNFMTVCMPKFRFHLTCIVFSPGHTSKFIWSWFFSKIALCNFFSVFSKTARCREFYFKFMAGRVRFAVLFQFFCQIWTSLAIRFFQKYQLGMLEKTETSE